MRDYGCECLREFKERKALFVADARSRNDMQVINQLVEAGSTRLGSLRLLAPESHGW